MFDHKHVPNGIANKRPLDLTTIHESMRKLVQVPQPNLKAIHQRMASIGPLNLSGIAASAKVLAAQSEEGFRRLQDAAQREADFQRINEVMIAAQDRNV